jgi:hypothetical protein
MSMHTAVDGRSLAGVQTLVQQRAQTLPAPIWLQPDHLASHEIREHRPELLAFPALDFADAEMPGPPLRPRQIPGLEKPPLGAPGGAPTRNSSGG